MKKGFIFLFVCSCSHSLYCVWMSVVVDCADFSAHFFINCSGGTLRIENLTAFIYPYHIVKTCYLCGEKHMCTCAHTCMHVYIDKKNLELRQPNRAGQFGKGLKPWKESSQCPFATPLARLDPQKNKCVLIHYICHCVLHCLLSSLF